VRGDAFELLPVGGVPVAYGLVRAAADQDPAVGRPGQRCDAPVMAGIEGERRPIGGVPEADFAIFIACSQGLPVRREGQRIHALPADAHPIDEAPIQTPELQVAVRRDTGQRLVIGGEGQRRHGIVVRHDIGLVLQPGLASRLLHHPPDANAPVRAGADEKHTVRSELQGAHASAMRLHIEDGSANDAIPERDVVIGPARGDQGSILRRHRQGEHLVLPGRYRRNRAHLAEAPELHHAVRAGGDQGVMRILRREQQHIHGIVVRAEVQIQLAGHVPTLDIVIRPGGDHVGQMVAIDLVVLRARRGMQPARGASRQQEQRQDRQDPGA